MIVREITPADVCTFTTSPEERWKKEKMEEEEVEQGQERGCERGEKRNWHLHFVYTPRPCTCPPAFPSSSFIALSSPVIHSRHPRIVNVTKCSFWLSPCQPTTQTRTHVSLPHVSQASQFPSAAAILPVLVTQTSQPPFFFSFLALFCRVLCNGRKSVFTPRLHIWITDYHSERHITHSTLRKACRWVVRVRG